MKHGICEGKDNRNQCVIMEEKEMDQREEKNQKDQAQGSKIGLGI